ncbi:hypothetical protein ACLQ2Q_15785 [Microbacterium sp. DT81.1]|uniref:hypothetical protein n=1 Tax=Microbacterium sp. DT81.1 TaxID=3393413 RepID=UPI003CEFAF89
MSVGPDDHPAKRRRDGVRWTITTVVAIATAVLVTSVASGWRVPWFQPTPTAGGPVADFTTFVSTPKEQATSRNDDEGVLIIQRKTGVETVDVWINWFGRKSDGSAAEGTCYVSINLDVMERQERGMIDMIQQVDYDESSSSWCSTVDFFGKSLVAGRSVVFKAVPPGDYRLFVGDEDRLPGNYEFVIQ